MLIFGDLFFRVLNMGQESQVVIDGCQFLDNNNGVQFRDSKVTLSRSLISGSQWGLRCVYSDLQMTANVIENNLVNGVNIRDGRDRSGLGLVDSRYALMQPLPFNLSEL